MVLVDTNVLLDIATRDASWFEWSAEQLAPLIESREAAINPVIYTELAPLYRDARDARRYRTYLPKLQLICP